jgi:protease-4
MQKRWNKPGSLFAAVRQKPVVRAKKGPWQFFTRFLRFIGRNLRRLCTFIGAMMVLGLFLALMIGMNSEQEGYTVPDQMVLTLRLNTGLSEQPEEVNLFTGFAGLGAVPLTVRELISVLDHARNDHAVKAVAVSIEGGEFSLSQVQELRAAIKRFRESGKPTYAYSPSYAEAGGSMGSYYLAAAFEHIWMQPVGAVSLPGFDATMPFTRKALEKIGVNPQFYQRKEYKSVMENFTRDSISPENREMTASLLGDITSVMVTDIATDRNLSVDAAYAIINQAIFTDREAVAAKLVDKLSYYDLLVAHLRETLAGAADNEDLKMVSMSHYYKSAMPGQPSPKNDKRPQVGLIYAAGNIVPDGSQGGFNASLAAADKITNAVNRAIRDKKIKAIVLRIDSPGGSPTASETIRRAVVHAQEKGKPVIVSMGSMAGSGGYWIATDADRIFALPATLTGSIGVASGKVELGALMEKIGVNWEGVKLGENADIWSMTKPFTPSGEERMNAMIDNIYDSFTDRVAKGRKLSPDAVERLAKGRVWTGNQGLELGLIDELGGLDAALDFAATKAGAKTRDDILVVDLPRALTPFDRILELMNMDVMMGHVATSFMKMMGQEVEMATMPGVRVYDPMLRQGL